MFCVSFVVSTFSGRLASSRCSWRAQHGTTTVPHSPGLQPNSFSFFHPTYQKIMRRTWPAACAPGGNAVGEDMFLCIVA